MSSSRYEQEVGLLLVLLQVELVGLGPDLPVDVADVVAGHVLAMLGELDREAVVRAGVHARRRSPRPPSAPAGRAPRG